MQSISKSWCEIALAAVTALLLLWPQKFSSRYPHPADLSWCYDSYLNRDVGQNSGTASDPIYLKLSWGQRLYNYVSESIFMLLLTSQQRGSDRFRYSFIYQGTSGWFLRNRNQKKCSFRFHLFLKNWNQIEQLLYRQLYLQK